MRYAFAPIAFGLGANALVVRQATQCFKLEASGGASGVLGQLDDGQNRVGNGGLPTGCYCLDGNGGFTDSNGRGCILTPPTTQFQCDVGATPTNGFAVGPNGGVTYNGSGKFYACPVNDNGEYNVYTTPAPGQAKCVEISLGSAGSCGAGATQPASSQPPGSQPAGTPPVATATGPAGTPPVATATVPAGTPPAGIPPAGTPPSGTPGMPGSTGYPGQPSGMPGKPSGMPEYPGQPGKPQQSGKPGYPAMSEGQKPSQPAPGVPQESECVPRVVTVTVTAPAAPPAETNPAPSETKPAPPAETNPAPPAETHPAPPAETHPAASETMPAPPAGSKPAETPENPDDGVNNGGEGSCPQDLNGNYEYPHLIVPVDSEQPDKAHGTSYNGKIDSHTCTIFNFDIPASMAGKKCSAMFMLPKKEDLETSDYTMSGHGKCTISKLKGPADATTTYKNMPAKEEDVASMEMTPGHTYSVETGDCEAGKTVSYMICGSGDFSMDYFQDYNPSPIGMYVRQC